MEEKRIYDRGVHKLSSSPRQSGDPISVPPPPDNERPADFSSPSEETAIPLEPRAQAKHERRRLTFDRLGLTVVGRELVDSFDAGSRKLAELEAVLDDTAERIPDFIVAVVLIIGLLTPFLAARVFPESEVPLPSGFSSWVFLVGQLTFSILAGTLVAVSPVVLISWLRKKKRLPIPMFPTLYVLSGVLLLPPGVYFYALNRRLLDSPPLTWLRHEALLFLMIDVATMVLFLPLLASVSSAISRAVLKGVYVAAPAEKAMAHLLDALSTLSSLPEGVTFDLDAGRKVKDDLDRCASCVEVGMPKHFEDAGSPPDARVNQICLEMANGLRELGRRLVTPTKYTRQDVQARVRKYLIAAITGEWGVFERLPSAEEKRTGGLKTRALDLTRSLLTAAVPILLLVLVKRLQVVAEPLLTYLTVGSYIWAALSLLAMVDPNYSGKLGAFKDLAGVLPFGKKGSKD